MLGKKQVVQRWTRHCRVSLSPISSSRNKSSNWCRFRQVELPPLPQGVARPLPQGVARPLLVGNASPLLLPKPAGKPELVPEGSKIKSIIGIQAGCSRRCLHVLDSFVGYHSMAFQAKQWSEQSGRRRIHLRCFQRLCLTVFLDSFSFSYFSSTVSLHFLLSWQPPASDQRNPQVTPGPLAVQSLANWDMEGNSSQQVYTFRLNKRPSNSRVSDFRFLWLNYHARPLECLELRFPEEAYNHNYEPMM